MPKPKVKLEAHRLLAGAYARAVTVAVKGGCDSLQAREISRQRVLKALEKFPDDFPQKDIWLEVFSAKPIPDAATALGSTGERSPHNERSTNVTV